MTIAFRCGQCGQLLRVPDQSAGKNARCPKCNALMQVPPPQTPAPGAYAPAPGPMPGPLPQGPPFPGQQPVGAFGPFSGQAAATDNFAGGFTQPAPQTKKDPFAFLNPAGQPPPNPFADFSGATPSAGAFPGVSPSMNPYAAPAAVGSAPIAAAKGQRTGLPWETRKPSFKAWWDTMTLVLGSPSRAFAIMKRSGGLGVPIMFAMIGLGVPMILALFLLVPLAIVLGIGAGNEGGAGLGVGVGAATIAIIVVGALVYVVMVATVGALIAAGINHLCLLIVGGARHSYETTFRVVSYTQGALAPVGVLLGFIPYLGPLIQMVWMIALLITGLSRAHEISGGKAALAVLLPYGVCVGLFVILFILALGGALVSN